MTKNHFGSSPYELIKYLRFDQKIIQKTIKKSSHDTFYIFRTYFNLITTRIKKGLLQFIVVCVLGRCNENVYLFCAYATIPTPHFVPHGNMSLFILHIFYYYCI